VETIEVVQFHLAWQSAFILEMDANTKEAIERDKTDTEGYKFYTDGSGYEGGVGAAAVIWNQGRKVGDLEAKLGWEAEHTVYEAEITRFILALHMVKSLPGASQVIVATDNQATIQVLQGLDPSPGHYLLDEAHKFADELRQQWPGTMLKLRWVPRHKGVPGNEAVDALAKGAAEGHVS
jgi:ribonuclease HI